MKEQFTNVKGGDRVWSINYGWGEVVDMGKSVMEVNFGQLENTPYTYDGRQYLNIDIMPTLFWDEVHIDPPARPKRKITHTIERWINIYKTWESQGYRSREVAFRHRKEGRIACVKLTGTYTTWEEG